MVELADLTATEMARRIRVGTLAPETLMEACLERIAARDGEVLAFAHFDPEAARAATPLAGPLRGLPIGVKDVLDTADMPSEYGSPIWAGHRPRADAAAVAWARAAGAVVMGKTVTTEFATRAPGPTTNPHDATRTPGGSSSGSAAGVAAGFFPLAFGTQTAGSIIRPAAFCGVVGYKPSFGTIARQGMKVMSESLDTIGAVARSVADCALFVGAVTRRDLGDPGRKSDRAPRVGVCRSPAWVHALPETRALLSDVADRLARAGASVRPRELPERMQALEHAHPLVMQAESAASMGWEMLAARDRISDVLRERLEWGLAHSASELDRARAMFASARTAMPATMEGLDILLTPAAIGEAPVGLHRTGKPVFNACWTALHVPCVTVPAGTGPSGMPLGIQIVGLRGEDHETLAWAAWVENVIR